MRNRSERWISCYVDRTEQLANVDLVILPGSKSTIADIAFIRERGLAEAIVALHQGGVPITGICGGYQMLGRFIDDPQRIESPSGGAPGLGLLPHRTVFQREKQTSRVRARVTSKVSPFAAACGAEVEGYEIHAGRSSTETVDPSAPFCLIARGGLAVDEPEGVVSDDGLLFGTCLHGPFDNAAIRQSLVTWLRRLTSERGRRRQPPSGTDLSTLVDSSGDFHVRTADPYDRWADTLEASLDLPLLLDRCGLAHVWRGNA